MKFPLSTAARALGSIRKAGATTWCWFGIYLLAATIVLEGLLIAGRHFWPDVRGFALNYIFPESWHSFVVDIVGRIFSGQLAMVLASTGIGLGVVAVGVTLFPIKEKLSASFEDDAFPNTPRGKELSLFRQGLEEVKLLAFYAVFQSLSLYFGLQGIPALAVVGIFLGFWYLVIAMALDHVSPVFQRRGVRLPKIAWVVFTRVPLSLHLLGAVFILPAVGVQLWASTHLRPESAIALVVGIEVIGMAFATLAGCALGAEMIDAGALEKKEPRFWSAGVTTLATVILVWQAVFLSWWGIAIHRKSQVLKCDYVVDWKNIGLDVHGRPSPEGQIAVVALSFSTDVINSTPSPISLEETLFEVGNSKGRILGTALLNPVFVPAHSTTEVQLQSTLEFAVDPLLADWRSLISPSELRFSIVLDPPLSRPVRFTFGKFQYSE